MAEITTDTENMFSSTEGIGDAYNMSLNTSAPDDSCGTQYLVDKLYVKLLFVVLYFIIFCLGFFGNILGKNQKVSIYVVQHKILNK
jgi:hypothetical protein